VRRPKVSPEAAGLADRIRRARPPGIDPTGVHHLAISELAHRLGLDVADMLDDWDHFAAIRQYDGAMPRDVAERLAVDDVRDRFDPQRSIK